MKKNRGVIFLLFLCSLIYSACVSDYPGYKEIRESRSKIEPIPFEKEKWFDERADRFSKKYIPFR
jgi:hypothetical protein